MSNTLGAPFGGTTRGGHHGVDSEALSLITPPNSGGGGGIFEHFFGGTQTDGSGRQRGADLRYDMQISLEEAASGCDKEIELRKLDQCDVCEGSGAQKGSQAVTCSVCRGRGQVVVHGGHEDLPSAVSVAHGAGARGRFTTHTYHPLPDAAPTRTNVAPRRLYAGVMQHQELFWERVAER